MGTHLNTVVRRPASRFISICIIAVGLVFICVGGTLGLSIGLLFLLGGIILLFTSEVFRLDIGKQQYGVFLQVFTFNIGSYEPIPEIDYILIFDFNRKIKQSYASEYKGENYDVCEEYELSLVYNTTRKIVFLRTTSRRKAKELLAWFAEHTVWPVRDKTKEQFYASS